MKKELNTYMHQHSKINIHNKIQILTIYSGISYIYVISHLFSPLLSMYSWMLAKKTRNTVQREKTLINQAIFKIDCFDMVSKSFYRLVTLTRNVISGGVT